MKTLLAIAVGLMIGGAAPAARGQVEIEAMLILASNDPAPLDRRLERVDYLLRPVLRFETYRLLGQSSVLLQASASTTLALGDGHVLNLAADRDRRNRVEVTWLRGDTRLLSTAVHLQRGKPVVLGGVPQGDGRLIVTLTLK